MTARDLLALAEQCEQADKAMTPPPWKHHGASVSGNTAGLDHVAECRAHRDVYDAKAIASTRNLLPDLARALKWAGEEILGLEESLKHEVATEIAVADIYRTERDDAIAACAEVEKLRAEVERLRAEIFDVAQRASNAVTAEHLRAEELRAEVERLRDLLKEAHKELSTIEAITVSPSDTDGLIDLCRRMEAAIHGAEQKT